MDAAANSTADAKNPTTAGDQSAGSSVGEGANDPANPAWLDGTAASPAINSSGAGGGAGAGRLSTLVPTLGRMATRAQKASAPYLTYAAMASQEAARFTAGHAKKYVDKVHAQHRRGEAPPGQIDNAKVDWSGVGARFCSLSWYDRQLVENSRSAPKIGLNASKDSGDGEQSLLAVSQGGDAVGTGEASAGWKESGAGSAGAESGDSGGSSPPAGLCGVDGGGFGVGFGSRARPGEASVMATLKDLDPWVTSPLFEDECNAMDFLGTMVVGRPPFASVGSDGSSGGSNGLRDCPSPPRGRPGDGPLDNLCESWEGGEQAAAAAETGGRSDRLSPASAAADAASTQELALAYEGLADPAETPPRQELPEAGLPEAESVGDPVAFVGGSDGAVAIPQARRTPAEVTAVTASGARENGTVMAMSESVASATPPPPPPPLPHKPASVTAAFVVRESGGNTGEVLALWDGSNDGGGSGEGEGDEGGDAVVPGRMSSRDLLLEWLRREAAEGDEEAQFHLAQLFSPPRFEMKGECRKCAEAFGVTRYRHHCRHCGGSFCHEHAWHEHPIPKLGLPAAQRVCTPCKHTLELEDWRERVEWRLERTNAYLEERLIQYFDTGVDTAGDKALRVVDGAIYVAKAAPLGTAVKVSVEVMDVLMKYGTAGVAGLVLRREFVEAVEVLKRLSGVDKKWPMSVHEMTAAMYYLLAQRRGERGSEPNGEHEAHAGNTPVSDDELAFLRRMSALPLHFAYTKTALELQVLCNTTGWALIFHKPDSRFHQPAFSLLACRTTKTAALVVRGTGNVHDVITDIQAIPVPFPPQRGDASSGEEGWSDLPPASTVACCGMARAAEWLKREVVHHLVKLHREGHKIVILGHSLGGGVAALLGVLLKEVIPDVRVVAFATPACADIGVSKLCESVCTSVVLHDDVVPRVTPQAVRALLKDLLCTKEGWVKHLYDDWDAVVGRAKGLWAPRWRTASHGAATAAAEADAAAAAAAAAIGSDDKKAVLTEGKGGDKDGNASSASEDDGVAVSALDASNEWGGRGSPRAGGGDGGGVVVSGSNEGVGTDGGGDGGGGKGKGAWSRARWSTVDVRAVQSRLSRIVDDTSARIRSNIVVKDTNPAPAQQPPPPPPRPARLGPSEPATVDPASVAAAAAAVTGADKAGCCAIEGSEGQGSVVVVDAGDGEGGEGEKLGISGLGSSEEEEAEVVDELPLPELFVPGRIVHIYSHRGVYRATEIPRDHECLRTIPMYGNMLADHASLAYFDALQEIAAVRVAEANGGVMPEWVAFSESEACQLCKADFSWASTSNSEAQRARDKHNCRMCGLLVCGPCSNHRKPLPRVGVLEACRVCDRCFYGADPSRVA